MRDTGQSGSAASLALAVALVLPIAWLAVPGVLALDPLPEATGTGHAVLALLLAAGLTVVAGASRPLPRATVLFALPLAVAALALVSDAPADGFELRRSTALLVASVVAFAGGATLDDRGRRAFELLLVAASIALTGQALAGEPQGPLGNTGALSQAALPGAALGALALADAGRRAPTRLLGGAAAALFAWHAGTTPVLAGAVALGATAFVALLLWRGAQRHEARALLLVLAALAPVLWITESLSALGDGVDEAAFGTATDVSGGAVRLKIWGRLPALAADAPLLGIGPGQFRREFPPHRDPEEIELSTLGRATEAGNEVGHAHSDVFGLLVEYGLLGGGALLALLAWCALRGVRALASGRESRVERGLGAATIALLVGATLHTPLSFNPASATVAFAVLGALLRAPSSAPSTANRLMRIVPAALLLLAVPPALALVAHGRALAARQRLAADLAPASGMVVPDERRSRAWLEEGRALKDALEAAPDSPLALSLLATHYRTWRESEASRERALERWREVLVVRPHQVSALVGAGALTDDTDERRALWEHALELDPWHPLVLANLARLELFEGDPAAAFAHVDALERSGRLEPLFLRDLAARTILAGHTDSGLELYARVEPELAGAIPEALFARAQEEQQLGSDRLLSDALECAAHRGWARQHLANGAWDVAVRSLRQALRVTQKYLPGGDVPTRLALAGALFAAGREDDASAELAALADPVPASAWSELPGELREVLAEQGVSAPR